MENPGQLDLVGVGVCGASKMTALHREWISLGRLSNLSSTNGRERSQGLGRITVVDSMAEGQIMANTMVLNPVLEMVIVEMIVGEAFLQ